MNKKICCLIIVCMLCLFLMPVNAKNPNADFYQNLNDLLISMDLDRKNTGFEEVDFNSLYIGEEIVYYDSQNRIIDNISFYPIYENTQLIAIYTEYCTEDECVYSLGKDFVDSVIAFENNYGSDYFLVHKNNGLYVSNGNVSNNVHEKDLFVSSKNTIGPKYSSKNLNLEKINYVPLTTRMPLSDTIEVPFVSQGEYGLCWASSFVSVAKYKTGITQYNGQTITPVLFANVLDMDLNLGGTIYDGLDGWEELYGLTSSQYVGAPNMLLTFEQIKAKIYADIPLVITFGNGFEHMVVCRGYVDAASGRRSVSIMDPNYSTYKSINLSSDGEILYINYDYVDESTGATGIAHYDGTAYIK